MDLKPLMIWYDAHDANQGEQGALEAWLDRVPGGFLEPVSSAPQVALLGARPGVRMAQQPLRLRSNNPPPDPHEFGDFVSGLTVAMAFEIDLAVTQPTALLVCQTGDGAHRILLTIDPALGLSLSVQGYQGSFGGPTQNEPLPPGRHTVVAGYSFFGAAISDLIVDGVAYTFPVEPPYKPTSTARICALGGWTEPVPEAPFEGVLFEALAFRKFKSSAYDDLASYLAGRWIEN